MIRGVGTASFGKLCFIEIPVRTKMTPIAGLNTLIACLLVIAIWNTKWLRASAAVALDDMASLPLFPSLVATSSRKITQTFFTHIAPLKNEKWQEKILKTANQERVILYCNIIERSSYGSLFHFFSDLKTNNCYYWRCFAINDLNPMWTCLCKSSKILKIIDNLAAKNLGKSSQIVAKNPKDGKDSWRSMVPILGSQKQRLKGSERQNYGSNKGENYWNSQCQIAYHQHGK